MSSSSAEIPLAIIVACATNGIIGAAGHMPWRLSGDLKRFKALTMGKPVIMGRKTYDSIGRPLLGRSIIVVTRDDSFTVEGVTRAASVSDAISKGREIAAVTGADEVMVAGGGEIYAQTIPHARRLYLTLVHAAPQGDTRFDWQPDEWMQHSSEDIPAGEKDSAATSFRILERRAP